MLPKSPAQPHKGDKELTVHLNDFDEDWHWHLWGILEEGLYFFLKSWPQLNLQIKRHQARQNFLFSLFLLDYVFLKRIFKHVDIQATLNLLGCCLSFPNTAIWLFTVDRKISVACFKIAALLWRQIFAVLEIFFCLWAETIHPLWVWSLCLAPLVELWFI